MDVNNTELGVKKKRITWCDVPGCLNNTTADPKLKFFRLPNDFDRCKFWLHQLKYTTKVDSTPKMLICEKHFDAKYIQNYTKRSRLSKTAVPTLLLPRDEELVPPPSLSSMTVKVELLDHATPTTSQAHGAPTKHPLHPVPQYQGPLKRVKIKEEPDCLTVFVEEESDEEHEKGAVADEVEYKRQLKEQPQIKIESPKKKYSLEFKLFALELYFKSSNSYRVFQKTFNLPRISTLYRLCLPTTTVISQSVLKALAIQAKSMTESQKQCVVCVGTMNIVPNIHYNSKNDKLFGLHEVAGVQQLIAAKNILIVMVRGLFHNWKQTVAFAFLAYLKNNGVTDLINDVILKMFEVGLKVRVLMTDLETERFSDPEDRELNSKQPFFFLNYRKIYYMNDPLILLKDIRDKFVNNNFIFNSGLVAKWQYVTECFVHDCKKNMLRLAPKLAKEVIKPVKEMYNLKFTVDLFSKATAAAISTYIDLKVLEPNAKDTVQWIVTMSKLMEMLNFSSIHPSGDRKDMFSGASAQVDFLVEMLSSFINLRMITSHTHDNPAAVRQNMSFVAGFRVTINALLLLYGDLMTEKCWYPVVGLSQDCLYEFFDKIFRKHRKPTAKQVLQCINKFPIFNIFSYSCKKWSPDDLEYFTSHARSMPNIEMYELATIEQYTIPADENAEFYGVELKKDKKKHLALYLLYKGQKAHSECLAMREYACASELLDTDSGIMPFLAYNSHAAPQEFLEFIEILELNFQIYFEKNALTMSFAELLDAMKNVTFEIPCDCFPLQYIKELFVKFRLNSLIRYNNKLFRGRDALKSFVVDKL